jgi:hypothetical protein
MHGRRGDIYCFSRVSVEGVVILESGVVKHYPPRSLFRCRCDSLSEVLLYKLSSPVLLDIDYEILCPAVTAHKVGALMVPYEAKRGSIAGDEA